MAVQALLLPVVLSTAVGLTAPVQTTLPAPTGVDRVGTVDLHLVDHARQDPWTPTPANRELMVSITYPACDAGRYPISPWLPPKAAEHFKTTVSGALGIPLDNVAFPDTHGHVGAPVAPSWRGHPVVLYSPGYGVERKMGTALVEDLASHGYVVVSIDHTYDASEVEFPGGRLELSRQPAQPSQEAIGKALSVRVDDTKFVLDQLGVLNSGGNPDADHHPLPLGLRGSLDLDRIGMFGHSLGGATAAEVMTVDKRIKAGVDLDGSIFGAAQAGLDRPFLLMAGQHHTRENDPSWATFWSHLRGWHRELRLTGGEHFSYTDLEPVLSQLVAAGTVPASTVTPYIGTVDAGRAVAAQRAYVDAFFDLQLRHRDSHLLDGPSPKYPEISFIP